jgi:1,4-alpha-glucan branching enzyme
LGIPTSGNLVEVLNSDSKMYGGSGVTNSKNIKISKKPWDFKSNSAEITLPPLGIAIFKITK